MQMPQQHTIRSRIRQWQLRSKLKQKQREANAAVAHKLEDEETAAAKKDTEGEAKTDSAVAAKEYKRE